MGVSHPRSVSGCQAQDADGALDRELNNTWIYGYKPYCDDTVLWNDLICQVRRGNFFYENASSTYDEETSMVAAGGASNETNDEGAETGIPGLLSE